MTEGDQVEQTGGQQVNAGDRTQMLWLATALIAITLSVGSWALVLREPADPPRIARHPILQHPTSVIPTWTAAPQGSTVAARILAIDTHYGGIALLIGGERYLYHLSPGTIFPSSCLQRTDLRPGMTVTVVVPWYLSGDVYLSAVVPAAPCEASTPTAGSQTSTASPLVAPAVDLSPSTTDSPRRR